MAAAPVFFGAFFCAGTNAAPARAAQDFYLKDLEHKKLAIVIAKDAPKAEKNAALIIKKYLLAAVPNADIFISQNPKDAFKYKSVSIKKSPNAKEISALLDDFSDTCSNTISSSKGRVKIEYCSNPINAAGDFLRELGFDFYAPGELGAKIPNSQGAKIKSGARKYTPLFISSILGVSSPDAHELLALNGQNPTFTYFSHNLKRIFDFDEHPEFVPTLKKYASKKYLQPKFNSPEAAELAAKKAEQFFEKNPKAASFSFGINDSLNFDISIPYDESAPDRFISGADSISNAYYTFANAAAKKLRQARPEKFAGLIAYLPTLRHPDFPLEKNIAPFLCIDSANSYNENFCADLGKLLSAYAADNLKIKGLYSYIYGAPYFVPRPIEEYEISHIRRAANLGFNAYFAELCPIWAYDSFKLWAIQKVLRGSQKSHSELKIEFFTNYYGGAAGGAMEFFDTAKEAWQSRADKPKWLGLYMRDTVAELFEPEILQKMENALRKAEADAKLGATKKKVAELRLEFEKTKAFVEYYRAKKELFFAAFEAEKLPPMETANALKKAAAAEKKFYAAAEKNSEFFKNANRALRPRSFTPPTDELLICAIKKASDTELQALKDAAPQSDFESLMLAAKNEPKTVFKFSPREFEDKENLETALGEKFIIKYLPLDFPEFKIENRQGKAALKIANAFHCEFFKSLKLPPERVFEIGLEADYLREISSEAFFAVSVFDNENKCVLYREVSLPPLKERRASAFKIVFETPKNAARTTFGLYARQCAEPICIKNIEVKDFGKKR